MTEFVLVSCSKSKQVGVHTARDLYEPSSVFRKRRQFGTEYGDAWGILSAQFGYLRPWDAVPKYECHISERSPVWGAFVLRDLVADLRYHGVDQVTVLAGSRYVEPLVAELEARGYDVVDWNSGKRPGERESALKKALKPGEQATLVADGGTDVQGLDRVMIDIEALGLNPGAAILSIGAVRFDAEDCGETFYWSISIESCEAAGLSIEADTLTWWLDQDDIVRECLTGGEELSDALQALTEFYGDADEVWAYSPSYDCALLEAAYDAVGLDEPWSYRDKRDCRTLAAVSEWPDLDRHDPKHHALGDAIYQARQTVVALQHLEGMEATGEQLVTDGGREASAVSRETDPYLGVIDALRPGMLVTLNGSLPKPSAGTPELEVATVDADSHTVYLKSRDGTHWRIWPGAMEGPTISPIGDHGYQRDPRVIETIEVVGLA